MASQSGLNGVDMNNYTNLGYYSQMLFLKDGNTQQEIVYEKPSKSDQRTLQTVAHHLNLEYEYSATTGTARVLHQVQAQTQSLDGSEYFDFAQFEDSALISWGDVSFAFSKFLHGTDAVASSGGNDVSSIGTSNPINLVASIGDYGMVPPVIPVLSKTLGNSSLGHNLETRRTWRACEPCRKSKIRCTGASPCEKCQIYKRNCNYNEARSLRRRFSKQKSVKPPNPSPDPLWGSVSPWSDDQFDGDVQQESIPQSVGKNHLPSPSCSSRNGSMHSNASSGYQEIVFDSKSAYSDHSQASNASVGSGRRGPLSELARAGMNAVKMLGACWRCKFLRNKCDPSSPCKLCPKGQKSKWASVGCKRGNLASNVEPIDLCVMPTASFIICHGPEKIPANDIYQERCRKRDTWLVSKIGIANDRRLADDFRHDFLRYISECAASCTQPPQPARLDPLTDCILAIQWELKETPSSSSAIGTGDTKDKIRQLLPAAAVYQANFEDDELIAQSLICLRSCLEVLRVQASGHLGGDVHRPCQWSYSCRIDCISNLNLNCSLYMKELSRVFFRKENLRDRSRWWLSTFISFCIQSMVREALITIINHETYRNLRGESQSACYDYLYLPIRLFTASCKADCLRGTSCNDSLGQSEASQEAQGSPDLSALKQAVGTTGWNFEGVTDPYDFLKSIFGDTGDPLPTRPSYSGVCP